MVLESEDMSRTGFCVNTSPAPYFIMLVNLIAIVGRNGVDVLHHFGISTTNSEGECRKSFKTKTEKSAPCSCSVYRGVKMA